MKAILIDDETKARDTLKGLFKMVGSDIEVIGEATSVEDSVKLISEAEADVIFLDIELRDGSGFDVIEQLGPFKAKLVFTTAFDNYAIHAFRNNAIDYLLKPISLEELGEALDKVRDYMQKREPSSAIKEMMDQLRSRISGRKISIPCSNRIELIDVHEIIYCRSDLSTSRILLSDGKTLTCTCTLKKLETELISDGFYRVNNSVLVNLAKVRTLDKSVNHGELILVNGEHIEVSRRKKAELIKLLST